MIKALAFATFAITSGLATALSVVADAEENDSYTIALRTEEDWQLVNSKEALFFESLQPQNARPDDTEGISVYNECRFVKINKKETSTTIRIFARPGDSIPSDGYLAADYSTDPPSIKVQSKPEKYSQWRFHPTNEGRSYPGEPDLYHVENVNDLNKVAWLCADKKTFVNYVGPQKYIVRFRKACLSFANKNVIQLGRVEESK